MAAKLTWSGDRLCLGQFVLATVKQFGPRWFGHRTPATAAGFTAKYEREEDARQDCESGVRRLLKEAGVEVEP